MKLARWVGLSLSIVLLAAGACSRKAAHGSDGHGDTGGHARAPPTPDTTPIEALRTPAGLVLKITPAPSM